MISKLKVYIFQSAPDCFFNNSPAAAASGAAFSFILDLFKGEGAVLDRILDLTCPDKFTFTY